MARGGKQFSETDFREAPRENAPCRSTTPVVTGTAQIFDERGLRLVLSGAAKAVFTPDELDGFMAAMEAGRRPCR